MLRVITAYATRRRKSNCCGALFVALLAIFVTTSSQLGRVRLFAADRPNILFVFADDQSFETIAALGNDEIQTPNLDSLVEQGTTFRRAYNMGSWSGAVCVASRTMLNTGRFLWRANEVYNKSEQERRAGRFWSEHFKKAGYDTYMTGKWHVRANAAMAFDTTQHVRGGMPKQTEAGYNRPLTGQTDPWSPSDPSFGGFWQGGKHWSEVVADDAITYLHTAKKRQKPFFMYLAFNAPHDPRQSPQKYVDMYPAGKIRIPANYLPQYPYKDGIGCSPKLRDERLGPFPRTHHAVQVHRQEYYAIITHMDAQIGRILKTLKQSGQAENTYIVFTADHGLAVGHHGLFGKQNMYDHSIRVPFVIAGPGIEAGKKLDNPIYLQDAMPTTLELAGIAKPKHVDFKSLLPLLKNPKSPHYESIYGAYLQLQRAVIHDGHKLILYPKIRKMRLYNLATDPQELRDLSMESEFAPRKKTLFKRLLALQNETGDKLDLKEVFPELQ